MANTDLTNGLSFIYQTLSAHDRPLRLILDDTRDGGGLLLPQQVAGHEAVCGGFEFRNMILAARRLAALITMIRDYDEDETVSIVAHSQGCLVSLLAQAFLLDPRMQKDQPGARPADTLVLCNPPYSLIDKLSTTAALVDGYSGADAQMTAPEDRYRFISGGQTLNARLTTLVNIVKGVHAQKHRAPEFAELADTKKHFGAVGPKWTAAADRDNRGKVYLYFSPEDMTVAFAGVEGIGWQGVPDVQRGHRLEERHISARPGFKDSIAQKARTVRMPVPVIRRPLSELGDGFFQRVFTLKRRPDFRNGSVVMVGQAPPGLYAAGCRRGRSGAHRRQRLLHKQSRATPAFALPRRRTARCNRRRADTVGTAPHHRRSAAEACPCQHG